MHRARGRPALRCAYQASEREVPATHDALVRATAQRDLAAFCQLHHEDANCWIVHEWLVQKCAEAEQHQGQAPGTVDNLLQHNLNELVAAGSSEEAVYKSLSMLKQIEERRRTVHTEHPEHCAPSTPMPSSAIGEQERILLTRLFEHMDTNSDGRLTWNEFMEAMHNIDDDLDEEEQELISTALDLHGTLSLDQFLAVVQKAEESRDEADSDTRRLRHLTHKGRRPDDIDRLWGGCL